MSMAACVCLGMLARGDGWMAIYSVELAYYLSYVVVWEQGMVHVMLVP